jgi:WD40 repeat protein
LAPPLERNEDGSVIENGDTALYRDLTDAIRCVKVSPDGASLACGDWVGNIRIYDLTKPNEIEQTKMIEAHDNEVICLAYSPEIKESGRYWLASGSRDKSILVFDSKNDYNAVCAMQHH